MISASIKTPSTFERLPGGKARSAPVVNPRTRRSSHSPRGSAGSRRHTARRRKRNPARPICRRRSWIGSCTRLVTEEQLFKQWEPDLDSMTTKNFADLAATDKLSTTQECQMQTHNLEARIARVTFSKIMPEVSKTLLDAQ